MARPPPAAPPPASRVEPARLLASLRQVSDPARAPLMQAYMKSPMPFLGVSAPVRRALLRALWKDVCWERADAWRADVLAVWRGATYREERYAAVDLCGHRRAKAFQTPEALPLYEVLIVTGAWWDTVDELAAHRVGGLLVRYPAPISATMREWSRSDDLWKRRTAILCQLRRKDDLELPLLWDCLEPSLGSKEFFLRKAIGWALRQLAWRQPEVVQRYVRDHQEQLSPLSRREALKNLVKQGRLDAAP